LDFITPPKGYEAIGEYITPAVELTALFTKVWCNGNFVGRGVLCHRVSQDFSPLSGWQKNTPVHSTTLPPECGGHRALKGHSLRPPNAMRLHFWLDFCTN
jgi:hypothetical protein